MFRINEPLGEKYKEHLNKDGLLEVEIVVSWQDILHEGWLNEGFYEWLDEEILNPESSRQVAQLDSVRTWIAGSIPGDGTPGNLGSIVMGIRARVIDVEDQDREISEKD